jgi:hypothetical protein
VLSYTGPLTIFLVREAQLRTGKCSGTESISRLKATTLETPLTPPNDTRGSERLEKLQRRAERPTMIGLAQGNGKRGSEKAAMV